MQIDNFFYIRRAKYKYTHRMSQTIRPAYVVLNQLKRLYINSKEFGKIVFNPKKHHKSGRGSFLGTFKRKLGRLVNYFKIL